MELIPIAGQRLYRGDLMPIGLNREHQAGADRFTVELHRAGPANPMLAADMGTGQPQFMPQEIAQQQPRLHLPRRGLSVDYEAE
jgi:hypothetical protein